MAEQIQVACRERGFFYVTGHGVPAGLLDELADASTEFFALPAAEKLEIAMDRGGRAWRGAAGDDGRRRWDGQDLRAFTGSYGDYLLGKVSKVFPQLRSGVLG